MKPIAKCVRSERVWPKLPSIQGIRANLVHIVSLTYTNQPIVMSSLFCHARKKLHLLLLDLVVANTLACGKIWKNGI